MSLLENILARDEFNLHYTFNSVSLTDLHKNSGIHRLADCIARCLQEPHTAFPQGAMVYSLVLADLVFTGDFMKTTKNYRNYNFLQILPSIPYNSTSKVKFVLKRKDIEIFAFEYSSCLGGKLVQGKYFLSLYCLTLAHCIAVHLMLLCNVFHI